MRTFLTYVLAFVAASSAMFLMKIAFVVQIFVQIMAFGTGDPRLMAGSSSVSLLTAIIGTVGLPVVAVLWAAARYSLRRFAFKLPNIALPVLGAVIAASIPAFFGLTDGSGIGPGPLVALAVGGAAWGAVFWFREKSTPERDVLVMTYVLAAAAIAVFPALILSGTELVNGMTTAASPAYTFGRVFTGLIVGFMLVFVWALPIVGTIWLASRFILGLVNFSPTGWQNLALGALLTALVGFGLLSPFLSNVEMSTSSLAQLVAMVVLPGAVWGTVFWIRAPKPTTAGIAA